MASENIVAMPKNAETQSQNIAPGPPDTKAVAVPAKFPVPTCPAIEVTKD